ncbi:MAG: hypothetical protein AB1641_13260 [Thermodesulfobacteriota bacterium]
MRAAIYGLVFIAAICSALPTLASEYTLNIPEAEKKDWELGGRLEFRYVNHGLNTDSALNKLRFPGNDKTNTDEYRPLVELSGGYHFKDLYFKLLTRHEYLKTYQGEEWSNEIYEGYLSYKPNPGFTLDVGKRSYLWGKGYAWNPAGFINRPKDPDDPELNLEGYTSLGFDLIKSFSGGAVQTVALTPVIIPVFDWDNKEMGESGDINYALKLYLLIKDVDIDLIYFGGPNQPVSLGADFSFNVNENFEVHGEMGLRLDADKKIMDSDGRVRTTSENQLSWLLGLRYLNAYETTSIVELYHNGAGYSPDEIDDFFLFQENVYRRFLAKRQISVLSEAVQKSNIYYRQRNFSQDYLYVKVSQKEPFDILNFTPYITGIFNLADRSFGLTPGVIYSPRPNLELGFKVLISFGPKGTEYGEKADDYRTEFLVRYYF